MAEVKVIEHAPEGVMGVAPQVSNEEKTWAALAHASTLITLALALPTAGLGGLLTIFLPLIVYLVYRERSQYVAYHAMQAFALQLVATVGVFVALIVGSVALALIWVVSLLLVFILVGIILVPIAALLTALFALVLVFLPFVLTGFSLAAVIQTAGGHPFDYPYLGEQVKRWLDRGAGEAAPLV
ncbi:MAG: hypothetical protein Kow00124_23100 [Anaerolineae bacterium]